MQNIGKYAIIQELASGATSKVFLAMDHFNDQKVALKLIQSEVLRDKSVSKAHKKLLQIEASLVGKLQHPHIVQMLDASLAENLNYIVMEYVDGGTLEQFVTSDNLLPFDTVTEHMYKCCKALEYAQSKGVIHRDIKPANIMLQDGQVKISDLGAAQIADGDSTQVVGIGSPSYMSPEQITGEELTFQSDIYSLGVTMYQLLTGKLPFQASSHHGLIFQIVQGDPTPPKMLRQEIPEELDAIVMRAIQRDKTRRYQSWGAFASDLAGFLNLDMQDKPAVSDAEKFDALRALPFFENFSDVELWELLRLGNCRRVGNGEPILQEGDKGNTFFLLAKGVVKVVKGGKVVDFLHQGDCFGEIRRLPGNEHVRTTGIEAGTDCMLFELEHARLQQASLECRYQFDEAFILILLRRLDQAGKRISRLSRQEEYFLDSTQKVPASSGQG